MMVLLAVLVLGGAVPVASQSTSEKPNILLAIADDVSYPHMSAYGTEWVETPAFDRVAQRGILFENAYVNNPKCAPLRASLLTGRHSWQLGPAAHHGGIFPKKYKVYPEVLNERGYHVGYTGKGWEPGKVKGDRSLTGKKYNGSNYTGGFKAFLSDRDEDDPFCFWYGAHEAHRPYEEGSGVEAGKDPSAVDLPPYWPDEKRVRNDILNYAVEIEEFDRHLGQMLRIIKKRGELEHTLVVVTTDHGMPFPQAKGQIFELGLHVPLAIMWGDEIRNPGRTVTDYVSLIDLAPTFIEAAGLDWQETGMHSTPGTSLTDIFQSSKSGRVNPERDHVLVGREKHDVGRPFNWGYPVRGIIEEGMLYVNNLKPDRWPAGRPETGYSNHSGSPTKTALLEARTHPKRHFMWRMCLGKRPAEMLYDIEEDRYNVNNLADHPDYREKKHELKTRLYHKLEEQNDPRVQGRGYVFQQYGQKRTDDDSSYYREYMNGNAGKLGWPDASDYDPTYRPYWGERAWKTTRDRQKD
jgi:arylsulfatase A-like enzyme